MITDCDQPELGITRLAHWGLRHLTDSARQITSELVANAVTVSTQTAPPGTMPAPITLTITAGQAELTIRVSDPDPQPPPPGPAGPGTWDENGRGLIIVTALSHQWGTAPAPGGGKYVWATLRTDAPLPGLAPRKRPIPHARH